MSAVKKRLDYVSNLSLGPRVFSNHGLQMLSCWSYQSIFKWAWRQTQLFYFVPERVVSGFKTPACRDVSGLKIYIVVLGLPSWPITEQVHTPPWCHSVSSGDTSVHVAAKTCTATAGREWSHALRTVKIGFSASYLPHVWFTALHCFGLLCCNLWQPLWLAVLISLLNFLTGWCLLQVKHTKPDLLWR